MPYDIRFLRINETSIAIDRIIKIVDWSWTDRPRLTIYLDSTNATQDEEGRYAGQRQEQITLSGEAAEFFLDWQENHTYTVLSYVRPKPMDMEDEPYV